MLSTEYGVTSTEVQGRSWGDEYGVMTRDDEVGEYEVRSFLGLSGESLLAVEYTVW